MEYRRLLAAQIVGSSTIYQTIQAAVNAASAGATIVVEPGIYSEQVTVSKTLTLRGANAGVDARSNAREERAAESVVNGVLNSSGLRSASFVLNANNIVLDGFTIEGYSATTGPNAAVHMTAGRVGIQVLNNIVQDNGTGVNLSNNSSTTPLIVRGNLFRNNNKQTQHSGRALYSDGSITGGSLQNVIIDNNAFVGNRGWDPGFQVQPAIGFEALQQTTVQTNIHITNNIFDNNGKHFLAYNASNIAMQGNWFQEAWDTTSAGIRFEGGIRDVLIESNNIYGSGARAIRIDKKASSGPNTNFTIRNNNFFRNGIDGGAENAALLTGESSNFAAVVLDGPLNAAANWWGSSSGPGGDWASSVGTGDKVLTRNSGNRAWISGVGSFTTSPVVERQGPFWGTASVTGFNIQFEDHDHGGSGIAYNDTTSGNSTNGLHHYESVDIQTTTDTGGGYTVGNVKAGEWLEYTINVEAAGTYTFQARVASSGTGGNFHLEINGANISGTISVPNTGSSSSWQTISKTGINLPAGVHVLRVAFDTHPSGGSTGNFNWFKFVPSNVQPPPAAPTNLAANAISSSQVNLAWADNSNNETGFMIERKTGSNGLWGALTTTAANAISYSDTTVVGGTTYFYRVRAAGTSGDSANSNEASAITPDANAVYLSDLNWVGTPTNGWGPVEKDRSNGSTAAGDGNIITLNGVTYAKGLGTHADSEIIYNLNGGYSRFLSDIGVDDSTGNGTVVFTVFGDNQQLYQSPLMTQTGATQSIDVSVAGVQQLRLVVSNGGDNYSWDHADWAGARLVLASTSAPAAPSSLGATAVSASQIDLTWTDNASNETGFIVERSLNGTSGWTIVATPAANATSHSDTNLSAGTQYFYRVRAVNGGGASSNSNVASATTQSAPAPAAPSNLVATAVSGTQINLTWTDNSNNETGFILERSLNGSSNWQQIATPAANATSYNDTTGLSAGTQYFYRIRATNGTQSANSNVASATTLASSVATIIPSGAIWKYLDNGSDQGTAWRATAFNDSAWKSGAAELGYGDGDEATVVSFGTSSTNKFITTYFRKSFELADASQVSSPTLRVKRDDGAVVYLNGTEVWRSNMPTGTISYTTRASSAIEDNTFFTVTFSPALLVTGTNVIAVDIHQDNPGSSDISFDLEFKATVSSQSNLPAAPSALSASPVSTSQINLAWADNSNNETGFIVERSLNGTSGWSEVGTPAANATSFNDTTGLSPGTQYFYRVRAVNGAGASANSNVANATTQTTASAPAAPSNLSATASTTALQINLSWTDNAGNETGFVIERSLNGSNGWAQVGTRSANVTTFSDASGLSAGTQYFYRVRAVNDVGPSADSNVASATTLSAPAAPSNLAATAISASQINLTWTDNANNESGFVIERSPNGTSNWTQVGTPGANATSFSNTSLLPNTQYFYRIRAVNAAGTSADSNIASAVTQQSGALPAPWSSADIGAVNPAGSATGTSGGTYTVQGSGAIGGTADAFRFVYQQVSGNGSFFVRVDSIDNVDPLAMAGIMVRSSLAANATNAGLFVNASSSIVFTRRTSPGGNTTTTTSANVTGPYWLRLTRSSNTITAARSTNGSSWTSVGSVTISGLPRSIYIGLAVTSNKAGVLATGTFSSVD